MWQTVVVLLVIAAVLIYVVRHYVNVLRGRSPMCCGCPGGCSAAPEHACECGASIHPPTEKEETGADRQTPG